MVQFYKNFTASIDKSYKTWYNRKKYLNSILGFILRKEDNGKRGTRKEV